MKIVLPIYQSFLQDRQVLLILLARILLITGPLDTTNITLTYADAIRSIIYSTSNKNDNLIIIFCMLFEEVIYDYVLIMTFLN
jgi:hypothetical protein